MDSNGLDMENPTGNPTGTPRGEKAGNPTQQDIRISGERERDTPPPPTEPERDGALAGARRRGHLAALLREAHVGITPAHPALVEWVAAGLTDAEAWEAIERARLHKPAPQKIPANYLAPIVGQVVAEREGKRRPPAASHGAPGASQTKRGDHDRKREQDKWAGYPADLGLVPGLKGVES